jgi:endo-1,4-beta-mannosidase
MWRSYDRAVVRGELEVLARHGLHVTRSFCYWPDFMPAPDTLDEAYLGRYADFCDLSAEVGMTTIPTFLVGHMSGQNWDVPWRAGRDWYRDGWMLAQQAFFVRAMVARFASHPAVAGWLLSNEMPAYGGATDPEYGRSWAQLLIQAVRAGGGTQPVSTGDGAWNIETTGIDNGFRLRDMAALADFVGPHTYPTGDDPVRQLLSPAFTCELSHVGRPVILEEFGVPSGFVSEPNAAAWYRQVLHTSLLAGATGWLAWNNTDFDLVDADPYRHHPFELGFGITRADGTPKAALGELAAFAQVLDAVDLPRCRRSDAGAALLVSSFLEVDHPFTIQADRVTLREVLLQSYVTAKQARLPVAVCREVDGVPEARLILVGSTKALTGPTWRTLHERAQAGATVYVSWFNGDTTLQRGLWHAWPDEFFGITHRLRYGLNEPVPDDVVRLTMGADLGDLAPGDELVVRVGGNASGRAFLPLEPAGAEVLATDAHGRPALLRHQVGGGAIVLCAYPLEYLALHGPRGAPDDTWRLYRALAVDTRTAGPVDSGRRDVLVDTLERDDGATFVWLVSHADEAVTVTPTGGALTDLDGTTAVREITLDPLGVAVLRLTEPVPVR